MNKFVKYIIENKFNFNIDIENSDNTTTLSKLNQVLITLKLVYETSLDLVDLGLPSGTLWCKYNLDVNPKLLSKPEDWYGEYYAWGELKPNKKKCDWSNYKFGVGLNKLTKYCSNSKNGLNGFADKLIQLLPEDDVAYLNKKLYYDCKFHIPTKEQCEELIGYTQNYWVNNYNPNNMVHHVNDDGIKGLNGRVFIGKNKNLLFIPAAGCRYDMDIHNINYCSLWSSNLYLNYPNNAYYLDFDLNYIHMCDGNRCDGYSIRPVIDYNLR